MAWSLQRWSLLLRSIPNSQNPSKPQLSELPTNFILTNKSFIWMKLINWEHKKRMTNITYSESSRFSCEMRQTHLRALRVPNVFDWNVTLFSVSKVYAIIMELVVHVWITFANPSTSPSSTYEHYRLHLKRFSKCGLTDVHRSSRRSSSQIMLYPVHSYTCKCRLRDGIGGQCRS